ncbi:hypothetical protein BaRGS_00000505 [Batillaria attramentaria]|uniref:Uncharacterized protein n=1 Tax=Batillaria attramentaria TaxID=370345 RepID=A0ABD0MA64_9CAEN
MGGTVVFSLLRLFLGRSSGNSKWRRRGPGLSEGVPVRPPATINFRLIPAVALYVLPASLFLIQIMFDYKQAVPSVVKASSHYPNSPQPAASSGRPQTFNNKTRLPRS